MISKYFNIVTDYKWRHLLFVFFVTLSFSVFFINNVFIGTVTFFFLAFSLLLICNPERAILFLCVLFPFNNLIIFRIGMFDIRFIEITWILCCIVLLIQQSLFKKNYLNLQFEKYDLLFLCFIMTCLLGILNSENDIVVLKESLQLVYLYSLFVVLRSIFTKSKNTLFFIKCIFWTTIIFCLFGFIKMILGSFPLSRITVDVLGGDIELIKSSTKIQLTEISGMSLTRLDSLFWGPVGTANLLIIQYYLISTLKIRCKGILKTAIVIFLILTGSRAAWLGFYLLFIFNVLIEKKYRVAKFAISIFTIAVFISLLPSLRERSMELFSISEASSRNHFVYWGAALEMFKNNPLLGVGAGCFPLHVAESEYFIVFRVYAVSGDAHNIFLKVLAENGIIGLLFFVAFLVVLLKPMIKYVTKEHCIFKNIMLAFLGTFFMNMTMNAFVMEPFWILLALLVGVYKFEKRRCAIIS